MAEEQRRKAPESETVDFPKQRPIDDGDVAEGKHTEPQTMVPVIPGC